MSYKLHVMYMCSVPSTNKNLFQYGEYRIGVTMPRIPEGVNSTLSCFYDIYNLNVRTPNIQ